MPLKPSPASHTRKAQPVTVSSTPAAYADPTAELLTPTDDPVARWYELTEYEIACAYADGYQQACVDIAARHAELAATWRATGRTTYEQRIAQRIADMAATAARDHALHGTQEWAGLEHGAVLPSADWNTHTTTIREAA